MAVRLLVDIERLTAGWLRAHTDVLALVGTRVYTELPPEPTFPLLVLRRMGGTAAVANHLDGARVQFDAWADTKAAARQLAATVLSALHGFPGRRTSAGVTGVVTGVEETLGLAWSPDPPTDRPRYVFEVRIFVHP